jgi:DNA-binding CsgD family transcriptional regulator
MDGEMRARDVEPDAGLPLRSVGESSALLGLEAMNAFSVGVAIVDRRGFVAFANTKGAELIARRAIFRCSAPLALHDANSNEELRRAIVAATVRVSGALRLRGRDARPAISAVVAPLGSAAGSPSQSQTKVLLAMNELIPSRAIPNVWLSQLFGLTPTESSVTNWLVSGRTLDEYALDRGVSLATVRSQIKTVLAKTGMSRQVQLVAALARLPIEFPAT